MARNAVQTDRRGRPLRIASEGRTVTRQDCLGGAPAVDASTEACAFCAIASGEDHSVAVVCEEDSWVAFFPLEPATPGHTLVIPRAHFPDLWSVAPSVGGDLMAAVIRVGGAIMSALEPDGMNLISSSGRAAEQTVFHVHLHVVPRWNTDGFGRLWPPERPTDQTLEENIAERIRAACSSM